MFDKIREQSRKNKEILGKQEVAASNRTALLMIFMTAFTIVSIFTFTMYLPDTPLDRTTLSDEAVEKLDQANTAMYVLILLMILSNLALIGLLTFFNLHPRNEVKDGKVAVQKDKSFMYLYTGITVSMLGILIIVGATGHGLPIFPEAEGSVLPATPINNAPLWVNHLVLYLNGQPITDPQFWGVIQNLITTRLNSEYTKQDNVNIIIQGTVARQFTEDETIDVNLKYVKVVGLDTQRDEIELLLEYDVINTGSERRIIHDSKFTLYGDGKLLAAGSDPDDKTIQPWTKQTSRVTVIVALDNMTSAEMINWYNQVDVWVIEGSANIAGTDWDQFRSTL